jgi:hypothetical protein
MRRSEERLCINIQMAFYTAQHAAYKVHFLSPHLMRENSKTGISLYSTYCDGLELTPKF